MATAYVFYLVKPSLPAWFARTFAPLIRIMDNKYYMDWINEHILAAGARGVGRGLWRGGDVAVIDGLINGSAALVGRIAQVTRRFQTGYLYHYALVMIVGVVAMMSWFVWQYRY